MALLDKATCPHCWAIFETHSVLWMASHPSLMGDPRLGRDAQKRFLPTRFDADGFALDEAKISCERICCPNCHLEIPRACLELESWIVSVVGSPAAGKSYYLTALIHRLAELLPKRFRVSFTDTDPSANRLIRRNVQSMFGNAASAIPIPLGGLISKTQEQGDDSYSVVNMGGESVLYPRPFMFTLRPQSDRPQSNRPPGAPRILCLYDNAGESYLPGAESPTSPVTRHLAHASLILFLFDPTQNHAFRREYLYGDGDEALPADGRVVLRQQETILTEAANRVRRLTNLPPTGKHDRALYVVVTKQDVWGRFVPAVAGAAPLLLDGPEGMAFVNSERVAAVSAGIRAMLQRHCGALVDAAESFAKSVTYVGASSLGVRPTLDESKQWVVRPGDIAPDGVEAPILYGLNRLMPGLFPSGRKQPVRTS